MSNALLDSLSCLKCIFCMCSIKAEPALEKTLGVFQTSTVLVRMEGERGDKTKKPLIGAIENQGEDAT